MTSASARAQDCRAHLCVWIAAGPAEIRQRDVSISIRFPQTRLHCDRSRWLHDYSISRGSPKAFLIMRLHSVKGAVDANHQRGYPPVDMLFSPAPRYLLRL